MNTMQAKKHGVAAFKSGKRCVPGLDQAFIVDACKSGNLSGMLDAYIHGWTIAMLAEDAPADMPSVRELAAIEASKE